MHRILLLQLALLVAALVVVIELPAQPVRTIHARDISPTPNSVFNARTLWEVGHGEGPGALTFAAVGSMAMDSSRNLLVVDILDQKVVVLDLSGRHIRSFGKAGNGPGEFRLPTQVSTDDRGQIHVYDDGSGSLSVFSRRYEFQRIVRPAIRISNVRSMHVEGEEVFISGIGADTGVRGKAIHVFSTLSGQHLRSFGALPSAPDIQAAMRVGAGRLSRARDGGLWYAQPAPYVIRKFDRNGRMLLELHRTNSFLPPADTFYSVRVQGKQVWESSRPHPVATLVRELPDGRLIHQTNIPGNGVVTDIFSPSLVLEESITTLPHLGVPVGENRFFAFRQSDLDVPVVALLEARFGK